MRRSALHSGLLVLFGALLVTACGFRPAGTLQASGLAGTRIVDTVGETDIGHALSRKLDLYGVPEPAPNMGAARVLRVLGENLEKRQLSIASDARTAEYELVASATFELLAADGSVLIEPRTIRAESQYLRDVGNLLGTSGEERRLTRELQAMLVDRILSAVSVVSADPGA
ncbi:MAG: LPS assembly lipoprotein LptE [Pseudomonadales bacterium]|jgi:outer membrane lipopolysaccharide assembly protein LptE/RlpB|nr:LPS assembly lipoprotein LptE [Pseudomonadales bacterium]